MLKLCGGPLQTRRQATPVWLIGCRALVAAARLRKLFADLRAIVRLTQGRSTPPCPATILPAFERVHHQGGKVMNLDRPGTWALQALALLRIVAGLLFLEHGTAKVLGFPSSASRLT